jgi:hypothetical protein
MDRVRRLQRLLCRLGSDNLKSGISIKEYPRSPGLLGQLYRLDIPRTKILPNHVDIGRIGVGRLPSTNFNEHYYLSGIDRWLNVHFRLLRHDSLWTLDD